MIYRLGIDVGGTNTDAVLIDQNNELISKTKTPSTADVTSGILNAVNQVLESSHVDRNKIRFAMLGTTHCTNAIVERKRLCRVGVIRIAKPATMAVVPMVDWPEDLVSAVGENYYIVQGGHEFDGREITHLDESEILTCVSELKGKVDAIAITSVFSPISSAHELKVAEMIREKLGDIPVSLSHEIGSIGLLERENATILNAALHHVAKTTAQAFIKGLQQEGIQKAAIFFCQNDGTLMSIDYAMNYPILTVACGPTNSIRGASYLSGVDEAIVLDIGGTTSDVGVINKGFPRESSVAEEIGGVRTNFRMPDLISISLGGGTIVTEHDGKIKVGPESVGYLITEEALVFGGKTLTTTDIAVRAGMASIGDASRVSHLDEGFVRQVLGIIRNMFNEAVDKMKLSSDPMPLILVGGGSILVGDHLEGISEILRPDNFEVANALGAAIAQVSGQVERVFSLSEMSREQALHQAKTIATEEAVKAGADPATVHIVEIEDVPLAYLPGNATRILAKAAGDLKYQES